MRREVLMKSNFLPLLSVCVFFIISLASAAPPSILIPFDSENHDTAPFYWRNLSITQNYPLPALSSTQVKFGTRSLFFDGTDKSIAYLAQERSLEMAGKDFTIDFWYHPLSLPGKTDVIGGTQIQHDLFRLINAQDRTKDLLFYTQSLPGSNTPGRLMLAQINYQVSPPTTESVQLLKSSRSEQMTLNQWNHVALMWKQGKGYAIAINGRISSSNGWYNEPPFLSISYTHLYLSSPYFLNSRPLHGYLDQFRVTIGEAIWGDTPQGGTFTPPTVPTAPYNYTIYHWDRASDGTTSTTGDYTLTAPAGGRVAQIELIGSGGGGMQTCPAFSCFLGGNGGGGGAYGNHTYSLVSGGQYALHVGKAGKGGSLGYSNDMTSGEETFIQQVGVPSTKLYAAGGKVGGGGSGGGSGGAGGTSNAIHSISGQPGQAIPNYNGGAGGSSGSGAAGGTSGHFTEIAGYTKQLISGKRYGGGGAGGGGTDGGNGAEGLIVLTYTIGTVALPICGSNGCEVGETAVSCPADCSVSLPPVVPVSSCPLNQTLFKLYQGGNSHIANASTSNAGIAVCYSDIFGVNYTGANPHQCSAENANKLIWATGTQNAHVATVTSLTYATPYCYGDVVCNARIGSCQGSERIVARLPNGTATSNLHIGNASFTTYNRVLCCSSAFAGEVFGIPQWTTPTGTIITSAQVNQTVNLSVTTSLALGTSVVVQIEEDDGLIGDDDAIVTLPGIVSNGKISISLKLNDTYIAKGKEGDGSANELVFTGKVSGGGATSSEASLLVSLQQGGTPYLLEGNITGVYHGQVYVNGSGLSINHTFSRAGNLQVNWSIPEEGIRQTGDSFVYNLTTTGQKTLTLHVSNTYGGHAELQIGFLVVPSSGGDGLMTFIDYPGYYQIVKTGRNSSTTFIAGANTSFALLRNSSSCGAFICFGGICPTTTNNTDVLCGGTTRAISSTPQSHAALRFTWELNQGGTWQLIETGMGQITRSISLGSSSYSTLLNDKQIRVITNYTVSGTSLENTFVRSFTLGQCLDNGHQFAVVNSRKQFVRLVGTVPGEGTATIPFNMTACRGEDDLNGTLDDCVPAGWSCGDNGAFMPVVNGSVAPPVFCDDLKTKNTCENAHLVFPSQVSCLGTSQGASCVWDPIRNGGNGACGTKYTVLSPAGGTDTCTEFFNPGSTCVEGLRDVTIDATFTPTNNVCSAFQSACIDRADTLVCGRPAYELPFFGWWQMVIGGLGIIMLCLLRRMKARTFLNLK